MDLPRWTLEEIITRYELEPSLIDVFVEGQFDKDIIMSAYNNTSFERKTLYTADVISIDKDLFDLHKLTYGNKQKLIVLCRELSSINHRENVKFIVDRDSDHWFGDLEVCKGLVWTDFCDIETYFFEEDFVKELVEGAGKAKIQNWDIFYKSFCASLKLLFSIRAAARSMDLCLSYVEFEKDLRIRGDAIEFDYKNYSQRTLNKSKIIRKIADF